MPHRMRKIVSQCRSPFLGKHHKRYHHATNHHCMRSSIVAVFFFFFFSSSLRYNLKFNIDYRPDVHRRQSTY